MHSRVPLYAALFIAVLLTLGFNFPKTGESGAATGLGTGTTTGGSPPYTESGNHVYVVNISERRSADTKKFVSSAWTTVSNQHCVGAQFHSESWSNTGGTPPAPHVTGTEYREGIFITTDCEYGYVPSGTTLGAPGGSPPVSNMLGAYIGDEVDFVVQTSDSGAVPSGRTLKWYKSTRTTTYYDNQPPVTSYSFAGPYEYELVKLSVDDASLTTRKIYGQPNRDGQLPADPNSPLRHPNYNPWDYKGGIFVGNMPGGDKDGSGTARTAFFVNGASSYTSTYEFAALSVFDMGKPSDAYTSGAIDVGLYLPTTSDPKISGSPGSYTTSLTDDSVNWDNRWSITPGAVTSSTDYSQHPFSYNTLTNGNSNDYIVFRLTSSAGAIKPATALVGFELALISESSVVGANTKCWHYLSSAEHQDSMAAFPRNDCAPRVWLLDPQ